MVERNASGRCLFTSKQELSLSGQTRLTEAKKLPALRGSLQYQI